jgi:c-di-GMP-binding flagellar brake protein YcgR
MDQWDGLNRRRFLRADFPYTIHIYSSGGKPISTYTDDISSGGVRVVTQERLNDSDIVDLKIYVGENFLRCKGKIAWVREKVNSVLDGVKFFNAGIEFVNLSKEESDIIQLCVEALEKKRKEKNVKGKK